jgi:hypothetical protein
VSATWSGLRPSTREIDHERCADEGCNVSSLRESMVRNQIAARGVGDQRVLEAMRAVPREAFMAEEMADFAYEDTPLPIAPLRRRGRPHAGLCRLCSRKGHGS